MFGIGRESNVIVFMASERMVGQILGGFYALACGNFFPSRYAKSCATIPLRRCISKVASRCIPW